MILVTGATGFVGSRLVRRLVEQGEAVRLLIRPTAQSPNLPRSTPVEVAVSVLQDEKAVRSAMKGVHSIIHLASAEHGGSRADLDGVDIAGTQALVDAAQQAGVEWFFFLSHLGVDRYSAFPVMKAKAIAEGFIQRGSVPYTILRSGVIFGPGDHFTESFAKTLRISPGFFLMPGDGASLLQPIWIDDLITCILLAMQNHAMRNQVVTVGGSETIPFNQVIGRLMATIGIRRRVISIGTPYLRALSLLMEQRRRPFPISIYWLDYLAVDRTCSLDALPRQFGMIPTRFTQSLNYLVK
ncbi:MAG: NAD(P)H-binding protein [Anaerolineae bacterium]|nr:NAD(P)H-binding protein [Anaerolineae bacterium]